MGASCSSYYYCCDDDTDKMEAELLTESRLHDGEMSPTPAQSSSSSTPDPEEAIDIQCAKSTSPPNPGMLLCTITEHDSLASPPNPERLPSISKSLTQNQFQFLAVGDLTALEAPALSYESTLLTPIPVDFPMHNTQRSSVISILDVPGPAKGLNLDVPGSNHHLKNSSFVEPYKSEEEMYDSERIALLIKTKLSGSVKKVLGDPEDYVFPIDDNRESFHIERDLRKIKVSLLEYKLEDAMQRKYAKLCLLKHYDLLTSIYKRYCKIGRDTQWMTMFGWISLLRDCGLVTTQSDEHIYIAIFQRIYLYHHTNHHSVSTPMYGNRISEAEDSDPWTGMWIEQKKKKNGSGDQLQSPLSPAFSILSDDSEFNYPSTKMERGAYKFRKIGDRKLIGCIKDKKRSAIAGWLNRNDYKKAKMGVTQQLQHKQNRATRTNKKTLKCELIASENGKEALKMKIEWKHKKLGAIAANTWTVKLCKVQPLEDDDEDLPMANYVGLSRHEYFDALLCIARLTDQHSDPLYLIAHKLFENHLNEYIFKNIVILKQFMKGKEIENEIHDKLYSTSAVVRLFNKYAAITNQSRHMEEDAWCAFAGDLCSTADKMNADTWKNGGKPTEDQMVQCFTLSKPKLKMDEQWIDLGEFIRCLLYFTSTVYRAHPDAQYQVMAFGDKLDLVLKWCQKLDAKHKGAEPGLFRSPTLDNSRRTTMTNTNASAAGSSHQGGFGDVDIKSLKRRSAHEYNENALILQQPPLFDVSAI